MPPSDKLRRREILDRLGPAILQHPSVKRMVRNMKEAGIQASEVYRIEGSSPAKNLFFDVYSLRKWAAVNIELNVTGVDMDRLRALLEEGSVDLKRVEDMPAEKVMEPIIIGIAAHENGSDAVLDGQHRYVARACLAMHLLDSVEQAPILARFLEPAQWQEFLIPSEIAAAMHLDDAYRESGARRGRAPFC